MRAIISVSDKRGIEDFARGLEELGWEIYSTGGTLKTLREAGIGAKSISELTGFPEILDGRVKTLHPLIHGGILARRDIPSHLKELARQGIKTIDLVAVNLYPFRETVLKGAELQEILENIDIGGPTLIRASAKNYPSVIVIVDPSDYEPVLKALKAGGVDMEMRRRLAGKAFKYTALYDSLIARYFMEEELPDTLPLFLRRAITLRYGENPHQEASFYIEEGLKPSISILDAQRIKGKELSYNNILDIDSAISLVSEFEEPTVAIIKHNIPCGLASHRELIEAYRRAFSGDPIAAFGGVVALNRVVDKKTAEEIAKTHFDVLIAKGYESEALPILERRELILLSMPSFPEQPPWEIRRACGGFLIQKPDAFREEEFKPKTVTKRKPDERELEELFFAWRAVKYVKSNAIVLVRDKTLIGVGSGQPSRVSSVEIAIRKAGERAKGSVLASDAFFPFPDGIELAGKAGVTAIIQPGGSVRDPEVIETADRYNIAMVFTGARHFRH